MLNRIADVCIRRRRLVLGLALVAFVATAALGGGVASRLSSGGFDDPGAESTRAERLLDAEFAAGSPNIVLLVEARDGDVDDPAVVAAGRELRERLAADGHEGVAVSEVLAYWDLVPGNPLASDDGSSALVLGRFPGDDDALVRFSHDVVEAYAADDPASPVVVRVGGQGPLFAEINETIEADLLRAEMIAIPITLFLLFLVFRGLVAALLPLAIGALSVVGTFVVLYAVNEVTEVSVFALNLTTALGLGLAIDYSLFIVSRFREELRDHAPDDAVRRTVATAGRTVLFSALTVAASLCALLVFDIAFLRSFAYAGLAVAGLAGLYAVVVLPAMLAALGPRVDAWSIRRQRRPRPEGEGGWHRVATGVMGRPVAVTVVVVAFLALLGSPTLGMELGFPDDRVLPPGKETRDIQDVLRSDFSSEEAGAATVVATGLGDPAARRVDVDAYASALGRLDRVARVDAETGVYCGTTGVLAGVDCEPGQLVLPAEADPDLAGRFERPAATYLQVVPAIEPLSAEGERFVRDVRAVEAPFEGVVVGGPSAQLVDASASLLGDLPLAIGIIAVVTFVLLFMMFGSIVVPLKALVLNLLSLSAMFGAMVWVFQDGNGAGLLGFTPTGTLAATIPVLMFCVAFGLSMDYEVFLLSRIKEEHDRGSDNVTSVALGLQRTGGIVTAAAVIISVVFLAFATSEVSFIKLFGIGLTLAVLLDAFVIRGTLVPAFMRLAGEANWWAPAPLRRLHDRIGISEHVDLDGPGADGTDGPQATGPDPAEGSDRAKVGV